MESRKKGSYGYYIQYIVGHYKKDRLVVEIGIQGNEEYIYTSLYLLDTEDNLISNEKYDSYILRFIKDIGFEEDKYLNYKLNFENNFLYKLEDDNFMQETIENISAQIIEIFKQIKFEIEKNKSLSK